MLDRPQQGPLDEEALLVEVGLEGVGAAAGGLARRLGGAQVEQLAGVVPVVHGLGGVDALVALQPDQLAAGPGREHLGELGLADAGLALEQQRPLELECQEDGSGEPLVGQVPVFGERSADVSRSHKSKLPAHHCNDVARGPLVGACRDELRTRCGDAPEPTRSRRSISDDSTPNAAVSGWIKTSINESETSPMDRCT